MLTAFSGDWERGVAMTRRLMDLNRHHPGWYHFTIFYDHFRKGQYDAALEVAKKINMPEFHWTQLVTAATCGLLGRQAEADAAIESLRKYNPIFLDLQYFFEDEVKWIPDKGIVERLMQGLQKAGLKYGSVEPVVAAAEPRSKTDSGALQAAGQEKSIAVLPFADMSPAKDREWFCEGIAEEVLNLLTKLPGLHVASRTSAFRFKDEARDLRAIGRILGVKTLLEGSVRTSGSRLRVTAQLVNASDGYQLWSERFDRKMEDVFEVQDAISQRVVEALQLQLAVPGAAPGKAEHSNDLEAYQLFLKGRHLRYTKNDFNNALRMYEQAIERDPGYAPARMALAETLAVLIIYGAHPPIANQARAREELRKARDLSGESAHALGIEALLTLLYDWDARASLEGFERALELDPSSIPMRGWYSWSLLAVGRTDEALKHARRIAQQDPQSPYANAMAACPCLMAGQVEEAVKLGRRAVELEPSSLLATYMLGLALAAASAWDEANQWFVRAVDCASRAPFNLGLQAWSLAASGHEAQAREILDELERRSTSEYFSPLFKAMALSELDDSGRVRELLEASFAERSTLLVLQGLPCLRKLRTEPLMKDLAQRLQGRPHKVGVEIDEEKPAVPAAPSDGSQRSSPESASAKSAQSAAVAEKSIAVLPFANMSPDPDQEYFADGLAEEIINLLAQMAGLKVIARTSAFAFRGKEQDIRKIASALNVTHILEGSVRRAGSRIRVTAQLIDAADGSHLWSERYDSELSDIFAIQDEISAAIARALRIKLSPGATPERYMPKVEAYEAFLKARHEAVKVTPESLELARRWYEQAFETDPAFGMAHVGQGHYWLIQSHFGRHPARECLLRARGEAERALQIDPSLPEAHALLGLLAAMHDFDWAAAERHFEFPMAKQASYEFIRPMYSGLQFLRGNVELAIQLTQRAIEEDPLEVWPRMNLHAFLQAAGRSHESLEQLKKVLELDPNQVVALVSMAMLYADRGDLAEGIKIARRAHAVGPWLPDTRGVLAGLLRRNGDEAESDSIAKEMGSGEALEDARARALYHLLCGDIEQGADWAEKAIEDRDGSMMYYLRFVVAKGLRASHRWPKIAKMINLPQAKQ